MMTFSDGDAERRGINSGTGSSIPTTRPTGFFHLEEKAIGTVRGDSSSTMVSSVSRGTESRPAPFPRASFPFPRQKLATMK